MHINFAKNLFTLKKIFTPILKFEACKKALSFSRQTFSISVILSSQPVVPQTTGILFFNASLIFETAASGTLKFMAMSA